MRISTKGRYALQLMLDLALNDNGSYIPLKAVAQRQEISDKYLEQIIHQLSKAELVLSARGAQGGYKLARKPADYTVGEILRVGEGSLAPVSCLEGTMDCNKVNSCVTIGLYQRINDAVNSVVDHTSLQDIIDEYKQRPGCLGC